MDDDQPTPFVRERNKSRLFSKGRRISNADATSSFDSSTSTSSLQFSYSVNSQNDSIEEKERCFDKMEPVNVKVRQIQVTSSEPSLTQLHHRLSLEQIQTTSVLELRKRFEKLSADGQIIFKTPRFKATNNTWRLEAQDSIHEEQLASADEAEEITENEHVFDPCPENLPPPPPNSTPPPFSREQSVTDGPTSNGDKELACMASANAIKKRATDFPRNYRSTPRPKTEIVGTTNASVISRYKSYYHADQTDESEEIEEAVLREKSDKSLFVHIEPILEELIKTEESYVENLLIGINNYGNIFTRKDLPVGLRGKKYVLLGNVEQIAEFHRDEFLPMLLRNKDDLKRLFDEFSIFIDETCFYGYVLFTMNKKRSLKLCETYKDYFKRLQSEIDDKLGINSFLVQPIQRMARYPLLLQQFITTLFKHREFHFKPIIEACCRLEKKVRTLLTTINESEVINDIVECDDFNVFYQGKFRKVSEFYVYDHTLKRSYRSKVFIFDKCIVYTEIKDKRLVFRGCYPCERIGIVAKQKSFTLFYQKRKTQECDFNAESGQCELWLELITEMITCFANEERRKLKERYSRENDRTQCGPPSLALFRNSNRFSSDSGIGNMWTLPKSIDETKLEDYGNRATWYANS